MYLYSVKVRKPNCINFTQVDILNLHISPKKAPLKDLKLPFSPAGGFNMGCSSMTRTFHCNNLDTLDSPEEEKSEKSGTGNWDKNLLGPGVHKMGQMGADLWF